MDNTGTLSQLPAAADEHTPSQGEESTPNKLVDKESSNTSMNDQATTTSEDKSSVDGDTLSPGRGSNTSDAQEAARPTKPKIVEALVAEKVQKETELTQKVTKLESDKKSLVEQLEREKATVSDQASNIKTLEQNIQKKDEEQVQLQKKIEDLVSDKEQKEKELKQNVTKLESDKRSLEEELKTVKKTASEQASKITTLEQNIQKKDKNIQDLVSDKEQKEKELKQNVTDLESDKRSLEEELKTVKKTASDQASKITTLEQNIQKKDKNIQDLVSDKEQKEKELKQNVTDLESDKRSLEEELKTVKKTASDQRRNLVIIVLVGIVIAIFLPSILSRNPSEVVTIDKPTERCDPRKEDCRQFLSQSIQNLSDKYKDQESNSWRTLHAAALSHVSPQPKPVRPIVILVYWVNSSNHQILYDISKVYSSVLSGSIGDANIEIQGMDFVNQESESVQKHIAGELESGFKKGKKVAIIHDFDNLPSCSVLTFHNYCNNEDAPYTDVAIILTMTGNPKMMPGQKPKVLEESVGAIFHKKWSDCPEDLPPGKIDAILSRVANNVVLLR